MITFVNSTIHRSMGTRNTIKKNDSAQINIFDIIVPVEQDASAEEIDFRTLWKYKGMDAALDHYMTGARRRISEAIDEAERKAEHAIAVRKKQEYFNRLRGNYGLNLKKYGKSV